MTQPESIRRPYAPTSCVLAVIDRARTRNLPEVVDTTFMNVAGVEGQSVPRTSDALRFLNLVDSSNSPTSGFSVLANSPDSDLPDRLREIVRTAYREELELIDPAIDDQEKIKGVFQQYVPKSTTAKMVSLFLGLCKASNMEVKEPPPTRAIGSSSPKNDGGTRKDKASRRVKPETIPQSLGVPSVVVHGISEDDIELLKEEEFNAVWANLGKLVWRRSHRRESAMEAKPRQLPSRIESEVN